MPESVRRYRVCRMFGFTPHQYEELSASFTDDALLFDTIETKHIGGNG